MFEFFALIIFDFRSTLSFGHVDNEISPGSIATENITDPSNQTLAYFHFQAKSGGSQHVCVQAHSMTV